MALTGTAGITLCAVFQLFFGGSPLMYSPAPRGECANCCPIREPKDIKFLLYTKSNPIQGDTLFLNDLNRLSKSHLNKADTTILYLHGFSEKAPTKGQSTEEIRDAFLDTGSYNVILVDWSVLTTLPWYINAVQNSPRVGRYIARFLRFLISGGVPLENLHVIGFSLGAEVAGFAGKTLREWGIKLPRITGLDPAFPLYNFGGSQTRLSTSDANFVDVIHTDGGILGFPWPLGHADFYPNGGIPLQPGCAKQEIAKNRWLGIIIGCSHQRAWQYFTESIRRPTAFLATKCESTRKNNSTSTITSGGCDKNLVAYMGMHADQRLRGKFYLNTNEESPYGKHIPMLT